MWTWDRHLYGLAAQLGLPPLAAAFAVGAIAFIAIVLAGLRLCRPRAGGSDGLSRKRRCRWRRNGSRPNTRLTGWTCTLCGVEAYAMGRSAPRECKRALRPHGL